MNKKDDYRYHCNKWEAKINKLRQKYGNNVHIDFFTVHWTEIFIKIYCEGFNDKMEGYVAWFKPFSIYHPYKFWEYNEEYDWRVKNIKKVENYIDKKIEEIKKFKI